MDKCISNVCRVLNLHPFGVVVCSNLVVEKASIAKSKASRAGQIQKALVVEVAPDTASSTIIRHRLIRHDNDWNDSSSLAFGSVLLDEQLVVQRPAVSS